MSDEFKDKLEKFMEKQIDKLEQMELHQNIEELTEGVNQNLHVMEMFGPPQPDYYRLKLFMTVSDFYDWQEQAKTRDAMNSHKLIIKNLNFNTDYKVSCFFITKIKELI